MIRLAAETLDEKTDPIQHVAGIASAKIDQAIAMLDEIRDGASTGPSELGRKLG
jgi:hypothetical protein